MAITKEQDEARLKAQQQAASGGITGSKGYEPGADVIAKKKAAEAAAKYNESSVVSDARTALNQHNANKVQPWDGGTYGTQRQQAMDAITNRKAFSYDVNADALYQQYKDKYINAGRLAMSDTVGQASALTGGYGNSYAVTAGSQAYQGYLQNLNDVVPQLYELAYNRYRDEGQDMYNQYNLYNDAYNTEYGQYRDRVQDWNDEYGRLSDRYYNEANMDYSRYSDNRDYLYNQYQDLYKIGFANYQQRMAEDQWAKQFALEQAKFAFEKAQATKKGSSGGGGGGKGKSSKKGSGTAGAGDGTEDLIAYLKEIKNKNGKAAAQAELNARLKSGNHNLGSAKDVTRASIAAGFSGRR